MQSLVKVLKNCIPSRYICNSSYEFIACCKDLEIPEDSKFVSIDVESLFTNVPVEETTDLILDYAYSNSDLAPVVPRITLRHLLLLCTTSSPFMWKNALFKQVDGVSMGSPLGPLYADFYMSSLENEVIPEFSDDVILYRRYVDDSFLILNKNSSIEQIKQKLEEHSCLKFTHENEADDGLNFLDVFVGRNGSKLTTSVYRKATSSGECLNYESFGPETYKRSVVLSYLHRAYSHCSSWPAFHQEIVRIKQILANNGYPQSIVENMLRTFLKRKDQNNVTNDECEIIFYYRSQ